MAKQPRVWDGSQWQELAVQVPNMSNYAYLPTTPVSGFRNVVINGDFRINQRGFSSTTTSNTFGFDRWLLANSDGTATYSAQTFTVGNAIAGYEPTNFARIVTTGQTSTSAFTILIQRIEDVRTFAGQTATISFWAKASSGTPKIAVEMQQQFGSGGSTYVNTYAGQATTSTSWARYSITVNIPSISGKTLGTGNHLAIDLWTSAGTDFNSRTGSLGIQSTTIDIWGVQLEAGSVATPFEQRPIGTELALCQRYYYRATAPLTNTRFCYGFQPQTTIGEATFFLPVQMRVTPTSVGWSGIYWTDGVAFNATVSILGLYFNGMPQSVGLAVTIPANGAARYPGAISASGTGSYIDFSAEL